MKIAVLIPAYRPDRGLLMLAEDLHQSTDAPILVVDDGSGPDCRPIFERLRAGGCIVVRHAENLGKGAALKTGIRQLCSLFPDLSGIVTADADGQHLVSDILAVGQLLTPGSTGLILGSRDFDAAGVPPRSRLGNRFSALAFRLETGTACADTQTGLRGIPRALFALALATPGDRYDYEMNFLRAAAISGHPLVPLPIQTVYRDGNRGSHFHALRDSVLIFKTPLRYAGTALLSAGIDLSLFALFAALLPQTLALRLAAATVGARVLSGGCNFFLNRRFCFASKRPVGAQAARYAALFVTQMAASALLVSLLAALGIAAAGAKVAVDAALAVGSYLIQRRWVFADRPGRPQSSLKEVFPLEAKKTA